MPQNENRNHYYNTTKRNNNPAREFVRGNNDWISRRIYNPGYDTSRDYSRGYNEFNDDGDIYENEFVNDNENVDYSVRPGQRSRGRNREGFFQRVGHNIKDAWNEWRHHDGGRDTAYDIEDTGYPRDYGDDNRGFYDRNGELYDRERRRQRTQYFADNDFDSVYNAEDENSYTGYRRHNPYDYQAEFDDRFADYNEDYYNSENDYNYNGYGRGRKEFDYDKRKNEMRRRRARFSM